MKLEISETAEVGEVHLLFDPDGSEEVVVRFIEFYGDIIRQYRFSNLIKALSYIKEQGE